jgi:hypothetical protein
MPFEGRGLLLPGARFEPLTAWKEKGKAVFKDLSPQVEDGMGGRDLFRAGFHTPENRITPPNPGLTICHFKNLFHSLIPWIDQKTIGLCQQGRT